MERRSLIVVIYGEARVERCAAAMCGGGLIECGYRGENGVGTRGCSHTQHRIGVFGGFALHRNMREGWLSGPRLRLEGGSVLRVDARSAGQGTHLGWWRRAGRAGAGRLSVPLRCPGTDHHDLLRSRSSRDSSPIFRDSSRTYPVRGESHAELMRTCNRGFHRMGSTHPSLSALPRVHLAARPGTIAAIQGRSRLRCSHCRP
jgi:hypothetical protein